jgi:hypothetical protein
LQRDPYSFATMMPKRFASLLLSGAFKTVSRTHVYPQCLAKELSNYHPSAPCFSRFFSTGKVCGFQTSYISLCLCLSLLQKEIVMLEWCTALVSRTWGFYCWLKKAP